MSWKFSGIDIANMRAELKDAGYNGPFYDAEHVVSLYNVWIIRPLCTYPGGKTK